jgi:hypothetical protein
LIRKHLQNSARKIMASEALVSYRLRPNVANTFHPCGTKVTSAFFGERIPLTAQTFSCY